MLKRISSASLGRSDLGWLRSHFHFSFAEYYDPDRMGFGVLRVLNDDQIAPGTGFDTHPHRDMEIISYMVDGELTHADSMGNSSTIARGHVQYMSAGTKVLHSEFNRGSQVNRLLQIWILPDARGHTPQYGEHRFEWNLRKDNWLHMVSGLKGNAPICIHQDVNIFSLDLPAGSTAKLEVKQGRQAYIVQIEGSSSVQGLQSKQTSTLLNRDALELVDEGAEFQALEHTHLLAIEMSRV